MLRKEFKMHLQTTKVLESRSKVYQGLAQSSCIHSTLNLSTYAAIASAPAMQPLPFLYIAFQFISYFSTRVVTIHIQAQHHRPVPKHQNAFPIIHIYTTTPTPPPKFNPPPLLLGPTNPCLCLPVLPLPSQLYFNSLFSRPIFSCASSPDCKLTSTDTHCSMRPTVSVTFALSMGCWRSKGGALGGECKCAMVEAAEELDVMVVRVGLRLCCEGLEEKEPAEVFEVARERVDANVDEVMEVVFSR